MIRKILEYDPRKNKKEELKMQYRNAGEELDAAAKQYLLDHEGVSYIDALRQVLRSDAQLARRYHFGDTAFERYDAGVEIDRQAKLRMQQSGKPYKESLQAVLRDLST